MTTARSQITSWTYLASLARFCSKAAVSLRVVRLDGELDGLLGAAALSAFFAVADNMISVRYWHKIKTEKRDSYQRSYRPRNNMYRRGQKREDGCLKEREDRS